MAAAQRRFGLLRLTRSLCPYQELLTATLGQRITASQAVRQWVLLVNRYGVGIPEEGDLVAPPTPEVLADVPYYDLHELGIDRSRAETLRRVAEHSGFLHRVVESEGPDFRAATGRLVGIPGVGVWTAAVAGGAAFGDPDALRIGDFHVKNTVAWALRGAVRGDDEQMIADLGPYAGQRHRVVRWLELDGWRAPLRGPRRRIVAFDHF